jgi:hypothetical protein
MSRIVTTDLGRFRAVNRDGEIGWLFECPGCETWVNLSDDQWSGRVSADHASDGCVGGYHETHDYQATLRAVIVSTQLTVANHWDDRP